MPKKMIEALANGYSSESTQRELSNEYQHDKVYIVFENLCILVAPALEWLIHRWGKYAQAGYDDMYTRCETHSSLYTVIQYQVI